MSYAKKCKYGCNTQIVWNSALSKFKELESGEIHTQERCQSLKNGSVVVQPQQSYKITSPEQQIISPPKQPVRVSATDTGYEIGLLSKKVDNISIGIAKIMSLLQNQIENNPTQRDNMKLRQQVTELEEVIKKRGLVTPANELQSEEKETQPDYDQHVRDMVEKGKQAEEDEELDLVDG